jgi:hypothetical protein
MPKCQTCGNEYEKAFTVILNNQSHVFDSFECAIHKLAPVCAPVNEGKDLLTTIIEEAQTSAAESGSEEVDIIYLPIP